MASMCRSARPVWLFAILVLIVRKGISIVLHDAWKNNSLIISAVAFLAGQEQLCLTGRNQKTTVLDRQAHARSILQKSLRRMGQEDCRNRLCYESQEYPARLLHIREKDKPIKFRATSDQIDQSPTFVRLGSILQRTSLEGVTGYVNCTFG